MKYKKNIYILMHWIEQRSIIYFHFICDEQQSIYQ